MTPVSIVSLVELPYIKTVITNKLNVKNNFQFYDRKQDVRLVKNTLSLVGKTI